MVDSDIDSNTKDSNVNHTSKNVAQNIDTKSDFDPKLTSPTTQHITKPGSDLNNKNNLVDSEYPHQTYKRIPEDLIDSNLNASSFYKDVQPPELLNDVKKKKNKHAYKNGNGTTGGYDINTDIEKAALPFSYITKADFEQAIELTGYGKFHYVLLAICGLVSTSEEMDVISMSFILPSAQCDLDLNTQTKGWLNSIIFIGMMVGAYCWGSIADTLGRKKVLIVISFMNAICIVASSFSQSYLLFMIFRFLNGVA